ncbi:putative Non-specific serine/threonine protein kinase [Rhodotorula taiwanensis]|uniref:Putative Non-specific serine/threonine protein kinase n=1 Tax=Rhodotorula taiwanensis TaxID=741276 RepID=A0A2S5BAH5_9BASI|nr:putative Non-specific serine/threonine protein kinase [Rhodotorula taiwanensis]
MANLRRSPSTTPMLADQQPLPDFRLAEKLGQGAFGSVYKALNWTTGETCAVKQIDLSHISEGDLPEIMSEIDLLKNLHHPNIVQYRGYHRTSTSLYIILEYCENGSLAALVRKFGRIPESLVGLYVLQVLQGLQYLHEQGVIHRDIKGSNILATKEGSIKLADFGVATQVGGPSDTAVVGSPYWMAPEIVDQSGAGPSSDIWSLGALILELLTTKPPYSHLDPMPALFRIVADDSPPIPEGVCSAAVRDFLGQCFQKDPNLRVVAKKLLKHPWMVAARKQAERQHEDAQRRQEEREARAGGSPGGLSGGTYEQEVAKVQEFNEALRAAPAASSKHAELPKRSSRAPQDENAPPAKANPPARASSSKFRGPPSVESGTLQSTQARVASAPKVVSEEADRSAWDSDFEEGVSEAVKQMAVADAVDEAALRRIRDDGALATATGWSTRSGSLTIRPRRIQTSPSDQAPDGEATIRPSPASEDRVDPEKRANGFTDAIEEEKDDFSDLVVDEQDEHVLQNHARARVRPQLLRPADIANSLPLQLQALTPKSKLEVFAEDGTTEEDDWEGELLGDLPRAAGPLAPSTPLPAAGSSGGHTPLGLVSSRFLRSPQVEQEDSDEEDPFNAVEAEEIAESSDDDLAADVLARERSARQAALINDLVEILSTEDWRDGRLGKQAAVQLIPMLDQDEIARAAFVAAHGPLVVLEALHAATQREHLAMLLRVVNLIVGSDGASLEKLALVGGCSVVAAFASRRFAREIRLEAALFIGAMCRTSLLTLQMFVACQGLRVLIEMLDSSYELNKDLVWMAIDGVSRVFDMEGPTPRNDVCRVLVGEGLLLPLSTALLALCNDADDLAATARAKATKILLVISQADHKMKEAIAQRRIVNRLIASAHRLDADSLVLLLKTVRNVSMLPVTLDSLQSAGTIEMLVKALAMPEQGKLAAEIQNPAVNSLFNLCRLSKTRQDAAAAAGAIPFLQQLVRDNSPLKQFALPVLCDFAHTSRVCRRRLWAHDGVAFYLQLLDDAFWASPALEAIATWLQEETTRVEAVLLEADAMSTLVRAFCSTRGAVFEGLLEPVHKLARASKALAAQLAIQSGFVKRIVDRIERSPKPIMRLALLRLSKTLLDSLRFRPRDRDKVIQILSAPIRRLAEATDGSVLVQELAKSLQDDFRTKRVHDPRNALMRRTASMSGDIAGIIGRSPARMPSPAGSREPRAPSGRRA